jgi:plastocyanin
MVPLNTRRGRAISNVSRVSLRDKGPRPLPGGSRGNATSIGLATALIIVIILGAAYFALHGGLEPYASPVISGASASGQGASSGAASTSSNTSASSTVVSVSSNEPATAVNVKILAGASTDLNSKGYSPDNITVVIGINNTVTWTNDDSTKHTVTAADGTFDSGDLVPGQSYTHVFTTAGTYSYACEYHSWMKGTVIVRLK